jgi:hypothetical protein
MKIKYLLSILILLGLFSTVLILNTLVNTKPELKPSPEISTKGKSCTSDNECSVPTEYLIQSRCPFGKACVEGSCEVVCPMHNDVPNASASESYTVACSADNDCDCSKFPGNDGKVCKCASNRCVMVMKEKEL